MSDGNEEAISTGAADTDTDASTSSELTSAGDDGQRADPRWGSNRALVVGGLATLTVAALAIALLTTQKKPETPDPVAVSVPVSLSEVDAPKGLKLGVVVTLGQGQSEGSEWAAAAEGARVAQYRLASGGSEIELLVEDDRGTPGGGAEAVAALLEQGVSGIVFASSGSHIAVGLEKAAEAEIPLILPYASLPERADLSASWSLSPDAKAVEDTLNETLSGFEHPLLVDAGPGISGSVQIEDALRPIDGDLKALTAEAARRTGADAASHGAYTGTEEEPKEGSAPPEQSPEPRADALVLSGHPRTLAILVAQLQARNVLVPLILAPSSASPAFAQTLEEQGGSVSTYLETVGVDLGDTVALANDEQARAMSAYLQAVRQLSDVPDAANLSGDAPFADVAAWADVRSHDAVLALATAAGDADSTQPEQISEKLHGLRLVASDGVAGTALDFAKPIATPGNVQRLHATGQTLGLRPTSSMPLSWFPAPNGKG